jgi:hypothetical protein
MKKLLFAITLIAFFITGPVHAASYYGCASAAINADSTFCDTPTGSCAGNNPQTAATVLAGTHSLFANGCTITIPNTADLTVTATKLSNKDDGSAMVDGGGFTYVTANDYEVTINANIETGGTTGAALAVSGSGTHSPVLTIIGNITAGTAASMYGVIDSHTVGTVRIGSVGTPTTISGGTNATARGYYHSGASGVITVTGDCAGVTGPGLHTVGATATATVSGNCTGGPNLADAIGCYGGGAGGITVSGNIVNSARATGISGNITWTPTTPASGVTGNYIKTAGSGTAVYVGKNTDDASKALATFFYIDPTDGGSDQGSASAGGGGGAWAH